MTNAALKNEDFVYDKKHATATALEDLMASLGMGPAASVPLLSPPTPSVSSVDETVASMVATVEADPANDDVHYVDLDAIVAASVTEAPAEQADPEQAIKAIKAANGVVDANDPGVLVLVLLFKAIAGGAKHESPIFDGEPTPESAASWLNSAQIEQNEAGYAKLLLARTIAKHELQHGKKRATRAPKAASGSTATEKAPRVAKPKASLVYEPVVGSKVSVATLDSMNILAPRTKLVTLPAEIVVESTSLTRGAKNRHQFDLSRTEGYAPVMPCLSRLADTGNPYTNDPNDPVVQPHGEQYRPFVKISHAVWNILTAMNPGETIDLSQEDEIKAIITSAGETFSNDSVACVRDTLRDLWSVGLVEQTSAGGRKRRFCKAAN